MGHTKITVSKRKGHSTVGTMLWQNDSYTFGGFVLYSFQGIMDVRRMGLTGRERDLMDTILLKVEHNNLAPGVFWNDIAFEFKVGPHLIRRMAARLHNLGLIDKSSRGAVYVNPNYWFKGSAKEQKQAVFKWHKRLRERMAEAKVA